MGFFFQDEEESKGLPKNSVLHVSNCPEKLTREIIKEKVEEFSVTVAYVDYHKGDKEGWVRLQEEGQASEVSLMTLICNLIGKFLNALLSVFGTMFFAISYYDISMFPVSFSFSLSN